MRRHVKTAHPNPGDIYSERYVSPLSGNKSTSDPEFIAKNSDNIAGLSRNAQGSLCNAVSSSTVSAPDVFLSDNL